MRVERCFGFVDLCGFTAFTERFGDELAVVALAGFRTALREIAARRGVRITKWLGDGAMLSSPDTEATVAMVLEVCAGSDVILGPAQSAAAGAAIGNGSGQRASESTLAVRAGLARGPVIMFEGDDYIGRPTNVASRLCDIALPGQVLATRDVAATAPRWVAASEAFTHYVRGFDKPLEAVRLEVATSPTMVTDPVCKLSLPLVSGLPTRRSQSCAPGEQLVEYFCSTACALAWEQAQRGTAPYPFPF